MKSTSSRNFLMVQWLGLQASTAKKHEFDPWAGNLAPASSMHHLVRLF